MLPEIFQIYMWAWVAAVIMAPTLALLGCHLAARDRAMQTLCMGQGATLGVLLGIGVGESLGLTETTVGMAPWVTSFIGSAAIYGISEWIVRNRQASRNTFYTALFAGTLSLGYLVSALFPHLEGHMSQVFFGDLATLTDFQSKVSMGFSLCLLFLLIHYWRPLAQQSFQQSVFGDLKSPPARGPNAFQFNLLVFLVVSFSVQFLGFLFTTAALFLPTTLMTRSSSPGLRRHLVLVCALAVLATASGFAFSLVFSRLPTVPLIVLMMVVVGAALRPLLMIRN